MNINYTLPSGKKAKTARVPAPYRIGRNGTGWMEAPRPSKVPGYVSVLLTATGKRGQDVWSERRDVTLAQAAALI
jgi:hypothetical protein